MTIEKYLIKHEGIKLKPYVDTVGKLTIGVGRNLDDNGIDADEAIYMLKNDIKNTQQDLKSIFKDFNELPDNVKLALTDMMFNMGKTRFLEFKKMIQAIKDKDFKEAAKQAKDSKWCKQVKSRCEDNFNLLFGIDEL